MLSDTNAPLSGDKGSGDTGNSTPPSYKCAVCEDDPVKIGLLGFALGLLCAGAAWVAVGDSAGDGGALITPHEPAQIHIKLIVVAFMGSEASAWGEEGIAGHALDEELPLPQGYAPVRLNRAAGVLLLTTGVGTAHSASTIAGFGMDPRFDLTQAYWIQTGIAGIDPAVGSVGSAVWANSIVDATLMHYIDPREMPANWTFARFPLSKPCASATAPSPPTVASCAHVRTVASSTDSRDIGQPYPTEPEIPSRPWEEHRVIYRLEEGLASWAFELCVVDAQIVSNDSRICVASFLKRDTYRF